MGIDLPVAMEATHHLCRRKKEKRKKCLMFTSIDDAVEVDVDLVRESEGERSQSSENRE